MKVIVANPLTEPWAALIEALFPVPLFCPDGNRCEGVAVQEVVINGGMFCSVYVITEVHTRSGPVIDGMVTKSVVVFIAATGANQGRRLFVAFLPGRKAPNASAPHDWLSLPKCIGIGAQ